MAISQIFIRKNWRKYRETSVICDIAFLFVKHSAFWMKDSVTQAVEEKWNCSK